MLDTALFRHVVGRLWSKILINALPIPPPYSHLLRWLYSFQYGIFSHLSMIFAEDISLSKARRLVGKLNDLSNPIAVAILLHWLY